MLLLDILLLRISKEQKKKRLLTGVDKLFD